MSLPLNTIGNVGRPKRYCSVCGDDVQARGLCNKHYRRSVRGESQRQYPRAGATCQVEGCDQPLEARGWCKRHYDQVRYNGTVVRQEPAIKPAVYTNVHHDLREQRGRACQYRCVDCGRQARQWSYDSPDGRYSYSRDLSKYSPRCMRCHRRHDKKGD